MEAGGVRERAEIPMPRKQRNAPIDTTLGDQGVAEAQNNLGILYLYGSGTQQNYTEALKWFRKAVEQRNAAAEGNLGVMYENGWGLATNVTEAISCYRKAAVLGNSSAEQSIQRLTKSGPKAAPQ